MASGAGILHVTSRILAPQRLSESAFDAWYENEHAPSVLALPGVPSAIRYKSLDPTVEEPYLITYDFPSVGYASHPDFRAVMQQQPPAEEMELIYKNAAFDVRFFAELATPTTPTPTPTTTAAEAERLKGAQMVSIAIFPGAGREAEFQGWFAEELPSLLGRVEGFVRLRRFEYVAGSRVLIPPRETAEEGKAYLVLGVFEGDVRGRGEVERVVEGWGAEVGWFGVKRVWGEGDVVKGEAP